MNYTHFVSVAGLVSNDNGESRYGFVKRLNTGGNNVLLF